MRIILYPKIGILQGIGGHKYRKFELDFNFIDSREYEGKTSFGSF